MKEPSTFGDGEDGRDSPTRRQFVKSGGAVALTLGVAPLLAACGEGESSGGTAQPRASDKIPTAAFDPNRPAGPKSTLPRRIGWAAPAQSEFADTETKAIRTAADDRGVEILVANAGGDASKNVQQINSFMSRGIGALALEPLEIETQRPLQEQLVQKGVAVMNTQTGPSTFRVAADQKLIGNTLGQAAADYIKASLGGSATAVHFEEGALAPALKERDQAVREALRKAGPDVKVIGVSVGKAETTQNGFNLMNTVLQKDPNVNVVVGDDASVTGALAALEAVGRDGDNLYLAGINGLPEALKKIKQGGGPYKASFAFAINLFGYAYGAYAVDWLDGKNIPQVAYVAPIRLDSAATVTEFQTDMEFANLDATFTDDEKLGKYFKRVGNVSVGKNVYLTKDF